MAGVACSEDGSGEITFYVAPSGNDTWSGRFPAANAEGNDGPFATIGRAQQAVRDSKREGKLPAPVRVLLRGGIYILDTPLTLGAADSGTPDADWRHTNAPGVPVTYAAFSGERPVISGGRRITGWREEQVHGRTAWVTTIPEVQRGEWCFRQLWVNGERRVRPCLPKQGFYRIAELIGARFEGDWGETVRHGADRFGYADDDLQPWRNLGDVEVTVLTLWMSVYLHIKELDEANHRVIFTANSGIRLSDDFTTDGARYVVENVFEALDEPGQWYLDRPTGKLYYLPLPGETPDNVEVMAPRLPELVHIEGKDAESAPAECLRFEGITFAHTEWPIPPDRTYFSQSATEVPAAVTLHNLRNGSFEGCTFEHLGTQGLELAGGCSDLEVRRCDFRDLGAGAVRIWHGCRRNTVADCEMGPGGLLFPSAAGVVIGLASGNQVVHNHIHHFYYTGISVGWTWGYTEGNAYGNIIEWNRIHDIGQGLLSDLAGIYTLGVSPGTRLRYNVIHDARCHTYGAFGIYLDEGTSDILVESNLCHLCESGSFNQHYGENNLVRNNIFALGTESQFSRGHAEDHRSFTFESNIVYLTEGKLIGTRYGGSPWAPGNAEFRGNLYWDAAGRPLSFDDRTMAEWQASGMDAGSIAADPLFVGSQAGDFRLRPESPAFALGFKEWNPSLAGPRPR